MIKLQREPPEVPLAWMYQSWLVRHIVIGRLQERIASVPYSVAEQGWSWLIYTLKEAAACMNPTTILPLYICKKQFRKKSHRIS